MKILLALTPLLLIGCLPHRLVPYDYSIEKDNREAYIEVDSVTISLTNLEVQNDHFVFGMEVQNNRNEPVFIDVNKMQKFASEISYQDTLKSQTLQELIPAMTPIQVNQFFMAKKKDAQGAAFFLFLLGAAITAYDAVKDAEDESKNTWTEKDEKNSAIRNIVTTAGLLATDALTEAAFASEENAETELLYLPDELFDAYAISPGEQYYGKILFKKISFLQKYHRVILPMEDGRFIFDFRKATPKERRYLYEQGQ